MSFGAHRLRGFIPIQKDSGCLTIVKTKQMPDITLREKNNKGLLACVEKKMSAVQKIPLRYRQLQEYGL